MWLQKPKAKPPGKTRRRPLKIVDLRKVGMIRSAPEVDGKPVLVFEVRTNGVLTPAG